MQIEKLYCLEFDKSFNNFAINKTTQKCGKIYLV